MEGTSTFDSIIEQIGNAGLYQKRFNIAINFMLVMFAAMANWSLVVAIATPDHWCHVPGRSSTNYTLEEWKNMTIPKMLDSRGLLSYSKCKRYAAIQITLQNVSTSEPDHTACDYGWEYDTTWYDVTAVTQNNWVCDDALVSSNILAFGRGSEVVGTFIFAQLADNFGRKPILFATIVIVVVGRSVSTIMSQWVYAFVVFCMIGSLPNSSVTQGPLVIALEISSAENRGFISMTQCYGWNTGIIIMSLIMWWLRDWVPFLLTTSLPCALFLFAYPWIIESPRWLASKGKIKECYKELQQVARVNKSKISSNVEELLRKSVDTQGDTKPHAILSLFSSFRLAINTMLLVACWAVMLLIYMCLTINITNSGGNPFLNFMTQAAAELPASWIAKYISDKFGRRYCSISSYVLSGTICIIIIIIDSSQSIIVNSLCAAIKFSISLAFYSVTLQSMEIYPTCIRQTGIAAGVIFGSSFGVLSPYIITLGTVSNQLPYCIYATICFLTVICCFFLPETRGHHLPETLADAAKFGAGQNIWGRSKSISVDGKTEDGVEDPLTKSII